MLGATSAPHRLALQDHLYRRSRILVHPWFPQPNNLFTVLRTTGAVISGSSALRFMSPENQWPNGLDIYVPATRIHLFRAFLVFEGYVAPPFGYPTDTTKKTTQVTQFQVFWKGPGSYPGPIKLLVCTKAAVFGSIVKSPLSSQMNFLSADGFFSAYPILTAKKMAIANPLALVPFHPDVLEIAQQAYHRYTMRGFSLSHLPSNHDLDPAKVHIQKAFPHSCHRSPDCPHTLRSTFDTGCLFVSIHKPDNQDFRRIPTPMLYKPNNGTVWNMGGSPCTGDGHYETIRPAVLSNYAP